MSQVGSTSPGGLQAEVTSMTVWPSVAGMTWLGLPVGQQLGKLYSIRTGTYVFTVGNLFCLLSIPIALILYLKRVGPVVGVRYRLTNMRMLVERGLTYREERSIRLDQFDAIDIEVLPGYEWFDAGDLVFRHGNTVVFRLPAVGRPQAFREICWKAHVAYLSVKKVFEPVA